MHLSATTRILAGLAAGAAVGLALAALDPDLGARAAAVARPVGKLWLNALQMTVVPLVFALVVLGVSAAADAATSGRTARQALVVFAILLSLGAAIAAVAAPAVLALLPRDALGIDRLLAAIPAHDAATQVPAGVADWITGILPSNALAAAAQSAMLPLVMFALFFGFALVRIDAGRRKTLLDLCHALADTMIVIVQWVLWIAPLGVFALVLVVCATSGFVVLGALGAYVALLCGLYAVVTLLLYPVAVVFGGERLRRFAAGILPAQVVAASTQSSLASLPAMIDCTRNRLGHPPAVVSLVLPMAVSLFRVTSPVQYIGASCFIAWIYGIDIGALHLAAAAALAVVVSLGSVGLPGPVSFMATNVPVAAALGVPLPPLALMLAVDTVPDMVATLGNVTGDMTASSIVSRRQRTADSAADA